MTTRQELAREFEKYWQTGDYAHTAAVAACACTPPTDVPPGRFRPGDQVHIRGGGDTVWRVVRRDYWHGDREPAYRLCLGEGQRARARYVYDSNLVPVDVHHGGSPV